MAADMEAYIAKVDQKLDAHIADNLTANALNSADHDELKESTAVIEKKLDEAMLFQNKLRWTIGVGSTILGVLLLILYQHLPFLWDILPKHGHTH